uniref:Carboxypeptidase B-like n=1 Tax=Ciona intestinalis TaxID=7719 RepID=F6ST69_CIOIN|nr:carboxypeptidase B-like [Ciona intestinalis]|eukprot:XP_002131554.1 carboxypeptidase B-like [Ciona intestinalis]
MKLFLVFTLATLAFAKRFDGDQVLTLHPTSSEHVITINEMEEFADFWRPDSPSLVREGSPVDVRIPREYLFKTKRVLAAINMDFEVKVNDVQDTIDHQFTGTKTPYAGAYDYDVYHTDVEIESWAFDMQSQYSSLLKVETPTKSEENRNIVRLTMGSSQNNPIFLIDCGIHAREWISPAFCQCFVNRMLSQYNTDANVRSMMDALTFVIYPLLNVDGYAYTWSDDRMWRKTRSNYGTVCTGVDPNRNFDAEWSGPGSSSNPCSDTYYGPEVASEQLSKELSNFVLSHTGEIQAYLTFHSYGQVYIYPYSDAVKDVDNKQEHNDIAIASAAALEAVHRKQYTYGPGYQSMYLAAGGSDDFSKDFGVPLVYTIELRDTGRYGFILPESQIAPSCEETYAAVDVIAQHVMTKL